MSVPAAFDLTSLHAAYASGATAPVDVALEALRRAEENRHPHVWIERLDPDLVLNFARALPPQPALPLYGLPFAIKDNIDLAGIRTTVACPDFAYIPTESAAIVQRLIAAGAIPHRQDQPRSIRHRPHRHPFPLRRARVRLSSGVRLRRLQFRQRCRGGGRHGHLRLGTDTAGSGRVPAAFNHIVGHKPTRGLWSCRGVFPACRSLDCPSVFALSCHDAQAVLDTLAAFDPSDLFPGLPGRARRLSGAISFRRPARLPAAVLRRLRRGRSLRAIRRPSRRLRR